MVTKSTYGNNKADSVQPFCTALCVMCVTKRHNTLKGIFAILIQCRILCIATTIVLEWKDTFY